MEVRRAFATTMVLLLVVVASARAQEAQPSSTAAFPITEPPPASGQANPSSRAGFPLPASGAPVAPTPPRSVAPPPRGFTAPQYVPPPSGSGPAYSYGYPAPPSAPAQYGLGSYGPSAGYGLAPGERKTESKKESPRYVSLTMSAIRLILPVFEATLEAQPAEHVGMAVFGGAGEANPKIVGQELLDTSDRFSLKEIGGQVVFYPFSAFDGFVFGAELLYTKVSGTVETESLNVNASMLAFGPLLGGKWIHESGFTLLAHAGIQRAWLKAETTAYGVPGSENESTWFPLLNVNVGWSF